MTFTIKTDIYNALNSITGVTVFQQLPEIIGTLPSITFSIDNAKPQHALDGEWLHNDVTVDVDIFAKTSDEVSSLLIEVITEMLGLEFTCTAMRDIREKAGMAHMAMQFNG